MQKANNEKQEELLKDLADSSNRPKLFYFAWLVSLEDTTYDIAIGLFNLGYHPIRDCYIEFQDSYQIGDKRLPPITLPPISPTYFYHAKIPILKPGQFYHYTIMVHWDRGIYVAELKFNSTPEKGERMLKSSVQFFTIDHHPLPSDYFKYHQ